MKTARHYPRSTKAHVFILDRIYNDRHCMKLVCPPFRTDSHAISQQEAIHSSECCLRPNLTSLVTIFARAMPGNMFYNRERSWTSPLAQSDWMQSDMFARWIIVFLSRTSSTATKPALLVLSYHKTHKNSSSHVAAFV